MEPKRRPPERVGSVIERVLADAGLAARVEQAQVVPEWESLVGRQIAAVTTPLSVTPEGVLFVAVRTHAWMAELSLMAPELLRALNRRTGSAPIRKIRWQLQRDERR